MIEWNRNISKIYELGGKKIVSKEHRKLIFLRRELFFYDLFKKNPIIHTPEIYNSKGLNLQTYFIETEDKNIFQTIQDWAKVHSYFMKKIFENNDLLIQHESINSYIFKNINTFYEFGPIIKNKLLGVKLNRELKTLLHGDLQKKNMVTFKGNNYYFDFELGGIGHPGRDIASMIISSPEKKNELIKEYRENINFDYSGIEEDITHWLLLRTAQLYLIFDKKKEQENKKKAIKDKLLKIIQTF